MQFGHVHSALPLVPRFLPDLSLPLYTSVCPLFYFIYMDILPKHMYVYHTHALYALRLGEDIRSLELC